MNERDEVHVVSHILAGLRGAGIVIGCAIAGIIGWGALSGIINLMNTGVVKDVTAFHAGHDAARYALNVGGTVGAFAGVLIVAVRRVRGEAPVAWTTACLLSLFFIVAGLHAT